MGENDVAPYLETVVLQNFSPDEDWVAPGNFTFTGDLARFSLRGCATTSASLPGR
jgi:hypothetical protein